MLLSCFRSNRWMWAICVWLCSTICDASTAQYPLSSPSKQQTTGANSTTPLDVFQVHKPPPIPASDDESCSLLLMQHVFGFSYGMPFISTYTPPPCPFNTVTINLTVTSSGRQ